LDRLIWPKNQPYHNQQSGASLCSAIGSGTERGPVCGNRNEGGYSTLGGGGWVRPLSIHINTTINLSSARLGLNRPGNGEAVEFCGVHFFRIKAGGGVLRHH